jgi:hypothetical protein
MKWKKGDIQYLLIFVSALVLLIGLSSAVLIYRTSDGSGQSVLYYEQSGGTVYPVMPDDSRKYLNDMERYGGKANVLADSFRRWLAGWWQGKPLAFTVAFLAVIVSSGILYTAYRLSSRSGTVVPDGDNDDGSG